MTKSQLIDRIAEKLSQAPRREVEAIVNAVFDSMIEALCRGERIEIRGFGSFAVKVRAPREGRNPKTGQKVSVPLRRALSFTVGKELRDRLNPAGAQPPAPVAVPPGVPARPPAPPSAEPLAAVAPLGPRYTMS